MGTDCGGRYFTSTVYLRFTNMFIQDCVDVFRYSALLRSNGNRLYYITTHLQYRIVCICQQPSLAFIHHHTYYVHFRRKILLLRKGQDEDCVTIRRSYGLTNIRRMLLGKADSP
uniref:Uncharacterized protein n=1 Tax=Glossina pallidipes TaxID=7398 RepID=A0A1A9Z0H8_GLOPL